MDMTLANRIEAERLASVTASAKPAKVVAKDVNVYYGEKHALKHVDVNIPDRGVMAFIGPSGCGKSTFLRCINRMNDTISSCKVTGLITIDNQDIYDPSLDVVQLRARVGMVFQKPNPFPKSIYDNVAYGPRIHGLANTKSELDQIVTASLGKSGALGRSQGPPCRIPAPAFRAASSSGLCIARAIAVNPDVILMDEPCSALDPIATAKIETLIDELRVQLLHHHRHSLDAASGARFAAHGILPSRYARRRRSDASRFSRCPRISARRTTSPAVSVEGLDHDTIISSNRMTSSFRSWTV